MKKARAAAMGGEIQCLLHKREDPRSHPSTYVKAGCGEHSCDPRMEGVGRWSFEVYSQDSQLASARFSDTVSPDQVEGGVA